MGRGSNDQRSLAEKQLNIYNNMLSSYRQEQGQTRQKFLDAADTEINSPGYSDAEKNSMTGRAMESLDAGYDAGDNQMRSAAARTRNSAGLFGSLAQSAQDRAGAKSDTARGLETTFANEKQRRRQLGENMLASGYGIDSNVLGGIAGLPSAALNNRAAGISNGSGLFGGSGFLGLF